MKKQKSLHKRYAMGLALICIQFLFVGCAMSGQKWANQSIGAYYDSAEIDLLDWQYGEHGYVGNEHQSLPRAPKYLVDEGRPIGGVGLSGGMPVGDFLYVKWRVKTSGEIREDKVDLRSKLPSDMNNHGIHFIVKGTQLYVFLLPPLPAHTPPFNFPVEIITSWPASEYYFASVKKEPKDQKHINDIQIYPSTPMFDLNKGTEK